MTPEDKILLLNEARRRYPIGTVIEDALGIKDTVTTTPYFYNDYSIAGKPIGKGCVLYNQDSGIWSEIVTSVEPKECNPNCGSNHCDTNGCVERKRILTEPKEVQPPNYQIQDWKDKCIRECVENNKEATVEQIATALGISVRHTYRELKRLNLRQK